MDIRKLLKKMTLEEKLGQLTQINSECFIGTSNADITGPRTALGLDEKQTMLCGSTLNFKGAKEAQNIHDVYNKTAPHGIPLLLMMDVIHGYRTIYPIPLAVTATFDTTLMERCCEMSAKEASVCGVHVNFSPMVDTVRDARWGRVMESSGEDNYLAGKFAKAQVKGYQGNMGKYNVVACVKHFAGYGAVESGRDYNAVDMSERTLREYYLPNYKSAIDAGAKMVMTSFNVLNGVPSVANRWLVDGILRNEWGYDGVVITDYNAVKEQLIHGVATDEKQCAENAINASNDIEMMSTTYLKYVSQLLQEGKITMQQIDNATERVLKLKDELGLFENPYRALSENEATKVLLCSEHRNLARETAERSAVLLKNENVLPFSKESKNIAVIGELADSGEIIGNWYCDGRIQDTITVASGIRKLLPNANVTTSYGCSLSSEAKDTSGFAEAIEVAKNADAVIVTLGEHMRDSGEGNSKAILELPSIQYELLEKILEVNKNVAVLLFSGRPLALKRLNEIAPSILLVWQPGTEGGSACANLLFGKVTPQGKLPMSFPVVTGQCPIYYNHYNTGRPRKNDNVREQYSSSYIDAPNRPLYPFGYGLSYSAVKYGTPMLDKKSMTQKGKITARITVKNIGKRKITETVQLYIQDLRASCVRPIKELKGYQKVELRAGEQKIVTFSITASDLMFYNDRLDYNYELGDFAVFMGGSSAVEESTTFTLK